MILAIERFLRRMFAASPQPAQTRTQTVSPAFLQTALEHADIVFLPNDKVFYGEIPGFQGVHATARTATACRDELRSALQDWANFRLARGLALPDVGAIHHARHVRV